MAGEVNPARLAEVLELAGGLRDLMIRDERRIDALMEAVRDEAWQAHVGEAMPDGEAEARHKQITRELWRTIDQELAELRSLQERS